MVNILGAFATALVAATVSWTVSTGLDYAASLPGIDPVQCTVAGCLCGVLGYAAEFFRAMRDMRGDKPAPKAPSARATARAKEREKLDDLARKFAAMPKKQRELVAKALDHGSVSCKIDDPNALALVQLGILHAPGLRIDDLWTDFSVKSSVVTEISRHRKKWLDNPTR